MTKQEPRPYPPSLFEDKSAPAGFDQLEEEVSTGLLKAIKHLEVFDELPEDAAFFGINCTHALVRWLPQKPNPEEIVKLLAHPHASAHMKQNIFWALFRRDCADDLASIGSQGFFKDCGPLSWYDGKSWACKEAKRVYTKLLQADSELRNASHKLSL